MAAKKETIKEYAENAGVSVQAVYKQIKSGKLETITTTENGRSTKYILVQKEKTVQEAAPDTVTPIEKPERSENNTTGNALNIAMELLKSQLEEKDRLIKQLQEENTAQSKHIREQAIQLTELLENSQKLQAHCQALLEQSQERPELPQPEQPEIIAEAQPEKPLKRRGFWAWLIGETD